MTPNSRNGDTTSIVQLFTGSLVMLIGTPFRVGVLFLFELVAARYLGPDDYGLFSLAFTIVTLAAASSTVGLRTAVNRYIPYYHKKAETTRISGLVTLGLVWALLVGGLLACVLYLAGPQLARRWFQKPDLAPVLVALAAVVPLWALRHAATGIFSGLKQPYRKLLVADILEPLLRLLAVGLISALGYGVVALGITTSAIYVPVALAALWLVVTGLEPKTKRFAEADIPWREVFIFAAPLFIGEFASMARAQVNVFMLGLFSTDTQVGLFRSASQPPMLASVILTSFLFIYLPMATELCADRDREGWMEANSAVARWALSLAFPIAAACFVFPEAVLRALFGTEFVAGADIVRILALGYLIHSACGFTGINLTAAGYTKLQTTGIVLSLLLRIGLNILLIPDYGASGAAFANLLTTVFVNGFFLASMRFLLDLTPFTREYFSFLLVHIFVTAFLVITVVSLPIDPLGGAIIIGVLELPLAVGIILVRGLLTDADRQIVQELRHRLEKNL